MQKQEGKLLTTSLAMESYCKIFDAKRNLDRIDWRRERKSSKQKVSFRPFLNKVSKRTIENLKLLLHWDYIFKKFDSIPNELSDYKQHSYNYS